MELEGSDSLLNGLEKVQSSLTKEVFGTFQEES